MDRPTCKTCPYWDESGELTMWSSGGWNSAWMRVDPPSSTTLIGLCRIESGMQPHRKAEEFCGCHPDFPAWLAGREKPAKPDTTIWLRGSEAASRMGVSVQTIQGWHRRSDILVKTDRGGSWYDWGSIRAYVLARWPNRVIPFDADPDAGRE